MSNYVQQPWRGRTHERVTQHRSLAISAMGMHSTRRLPPLPRPMPTRPNATIQRFLLPSKMDVYKPKPASNGHNGDPEVRQYAPSVGATFMVARWGGVGMWLLLNYE